MKNHTIDTNQMSFADLGLLEAAPMPAPAPKAKTKKVAKPSKCDTPATASAATNGAVAESLKNLLAQAEQIGFALQEKYEANLNADRITSRIGISVDVEDVETLLLAIAEANSALDLKN